MSYTPPLDAEVTAFVTTASLAAAATYDSSVDWDGDVNGYTQVQTEITSDMDGTLVISFCSDSLFANEVRGLSIPYVGGSGYQFFAAPAFANFIKYSFTNNGVGANTIYLTTKLTTTAVNPQLLTTNAFIAPSMVASLTRSISVGQDPNDVFTNTPSGGISNVNSTDVPLIANDTYDGTFTDTSGYASTSIFVKADQDSAAGGLKIIHSSDGVTDERVISFTYLTADNPQGLVYMIPASTKYFRIQYVNGVTPNGVGGLIISIKNETSPQQTIALPVNLPIQAGTLSNVTKSVIVGKNDAGNYDNVPVDNQNHLEVNVSNPKTAYDELAVANLSPVSQITFPYNINPDIVTKVETAGGTVVQGNNNMAVLNTSTTLSSSCSLTSIKQIPYRAGLGHIARFACVFAGVPTVPLAYSGIGVGDAADGYGFLLGLGGFGISYRTNTAPTFIAQTAWNIDVLDGSGSLNNPSGMNLDINTGNSYQIAYGSGFGTVNFSVESDVSGDYVLVHTLALANTLTVPSVYNPTFPMRAEADNGNATDNLTISVASMSSFIEGKNSIEYSPGVINSQSGTENGTFLNEVELITFFNKEDVFGGTGNNKVYCKMLGISWLNETNKTAIVRLREEATGMAAGTFTDVGANTSVVSYRTDGTGTITGGKILFEAFAEKDGKGGIFVDLTNLNLTMTPGKKYTISAVCTAVAGANDQLATLLWSEDF